MSLLGDAVRIVLVASLEGVAGGAGVLLPARADAVSVGKITGDGIGLAIAADINGAGLGD